MISQSKGLGMDDYDFNEVPDLNREYRVMWHSLSNDRFGSIDDLYTKDDAEMLARYLNKTVARTRHWVVWEPQP